MLLGHARGLAAFAETGAPATCGAIGIYAHESVLIMISDNVNHDTSVAPSPRRGSSHLVSWRDRIKTARLRSNNMSQQKLADAIGVGQSTVASWEKEGGNEPSLENFDKIAAATSTTAPWLIFGLGTMSDLDANGAPIFDREAMQRVIELVERHARKEGAEEMSPARKARIILAVYDITTDLGDPTRLDEEVERLIGKRSR